MNSAVLTSGCTGQISAATFFAKTRKKAAINNLRGEPCVKHLGEKVTELERNMPGHSNWEGSFFERLTEYREWNHDSFWALHRELIELARLANEEPIDRNLAYMLLYLQQRVLGLISAHFAKNDVFKISNLKGEQVYEFKERFDMAILGVITGEVLPESSFDLVNPLLTNA